MRYKMVHATCCLAGSASYLDDIRADLRDRGISRAVRDHDTPVLFDWLIEIAELSRNFGCGRGWVHGPARQRPLGGDCRSVVAKPIVPEAWRVLAVL